MELKVEIQGAKELEALLRTMENQVKDLRDTLSKVYLASAALEVKLRQK